MTRTLVLCLLCGLAVPSWAQTSSQKPAPAKAAVQPTNVKVVAVPVAKTKPTPVVAKPAAKPAVAAQPAAKPAVAVVPAKPAVVSAKPVTAQKAPVESTKPATVAAPAKASNPVPVVAVKPLPQTGKAVAVAKGTAPANSKDPFSKKPQAQVKPAAAAKAPEAHPGTVVAVKENKAAEQKKPEPKKVSEVTGRDPFISPVVHLGTVGSGCATGKRCLAIDQIALRGVVKSENGMIAVVVNTMDKAYFLRENDPVFNGYVTKITPDSIIFKETFRDKLGKELTRDVTKTISRPAA